MVMINLEFRQPLVVMTKTLYTSLRWPFSSNVLNIFGIYINPFPPPPLGWKTPHMHLLHFITSLSLIQERFISEDESLVFKNFNILYSSNISFQ